MSERRRLNKPNEVEGHPEWTFGLVVRRDDGSAYFDLLHENGEVIQDVQLEPGGSRHVAACLAIHSRATQTQRGVS